MTLPKLTYLNVSEKRVLLRLDLDVTENFSRVEAVNKTLTYLVEKRAKTIIIGHKGRPNGVVSQSLSLSGIAEKISEILGKKVKFVNDIVGQEAKDESSKLQEGKIMMLENLRFDSRESLEFPSTPSISLKTSSLRVNARDEEANGFAESLALLGDFYVNEAFAVSHRAHASIVGVPKFLPHAAGFRFIEEVENLSKILEDPKRPVVVLISGVKEDKVQMAKDLTKIADKVLVGGRLPEYISENAGSVRLQQNEKMIVANLIQDKEDITLNSIDIFKEEIKKAGTIVLAGVLGKYEDEGHRQGTREIFEAVANSSAFKVAGGGDTLNAVNMFGFRDKFNWLSVGGGAMIEFLIKGTLPGIEALLH